MRYIKQLDSLRAFAVILVIISHWFSQSHVLNYFPNGSIGVIMFFVLSGFLITSILFQNRTVSNVSKSEIIKVFYARRTLRIFPIYYLTIFVILALSKYIGTNIKSDFIYYLTYTSNFNFFIQGHWDGMLSHLWTLAVEEQFYLIWPWLIVFTKKEHLIYIIALFILVGFSSRLIFNDFPLSGILTSSCFDSFGIGALLSWFIHFREKSLNVFYRVSKILSFVLISIIVYGNLTLSKPFWTIIPKGTAISILSIWFITYIYINRESKNRIFSFFLNNPILIFLGRISYGIYLYHNLIHKLVVGIKQIPLIKSSETINMFLDMPNVMIVFKFILLVIISWGSFVIIEQPFLKLKKKFVLKNEHEIILR